MREIIALLMSAFSFNCHSVVTQVHAKPDADLCMRVDLPLDKKIVENQDWATRPLSRCGPRAAGRWSARRNLRQFQDENCKTDTKSNWSLCLKLFTSIQLRTFRRLFLNISLFVLCCHVAILRDYIIISGGKWNLITKQCKNISPVKCQKSFLLFADIKQV